MIRAWWLQPACTWHQKQKKAWCRPEFLYITSKKYVILSIIAPDDRSAATELTELERKNIPFSIAITEKSAIFVLQIQMRSINMTSRTYLRWK